MVDLSKWLGEEYVISNPLTADHFGDYSELNDPALLDSPDGS